MCLLAGVAGGQAQTPEAKLLSPDAIRDRFGYSVAVSGDTAVVGAMLGRSAFVFTRAAGVWTQQARLEAIDSASGDGFGTSVTLDGDTAMVGAPGASCVVGQPQVCGAVYVFTRLAGVWTQQAKLVAADVVGNDFGWRVALDGDTVVVGADLDSDAGNRAGAAYVFIGAGAGWAQQAKLIAGDAVVEDEFGRSVSVSGDTVLVGTSPASGRGAAYVFTRTGGAWTQQAKLADPDSSSAFGDSVSVSGDSAIVGDGGLGSGSAYVFTRDAGVWTQQAELTAVDGATGDGFGVSVALAGDTALVGASGDDDLGPDSGSAYVFTRAAGVWTERAKLVPADGAAGDLFGRASAVDGDTLVVGNDAGISPGAAYPFFMDDDADGVGNATDLCPGTVSGSLVDAAGCATAQLVGAVAITVRDAVSTTPLSGVQVDVYDSSGVSALSGSTGVDGVFTGDLPIGTYHVRTSGTAGYVDELYQDMPCETGCDLSGGTPVLVAGGATTPVLVALTQSATVSGTVRDGVTSAALAGIQIEIYTNTGQAVTTVSTNSAGQYSAVGLPEALYVARTSNSSGYVDELYNSISCALGCAVTSGTVISTTAGQTFAADFALLPPGGGIAGTVRDASTGSPLPGVTVSLFDAAGAAVTGAVTNAEGQYLTADVPTGSYHARTTNALGYLDQLYDGIECAVGCVVTSGAVITHAQGTTGGFADFSLAPGNVLSGTVSTASGPLSTATVHIYGAGGAEVTSVSTDGAGHFTTPALPTAFYFAKTSNSAGYADQLFDSIACAVGCVVTTGTPISATAGVSNNAINFVLAANTVAGTDVVALAQAPAGEQVLVTFETVTVPGVTTVTTSATGPAAPEGFQFGSVPVFYDLETTAVFTDPVAVCFSFAGVSYADPVALRLLHFENGAWTDVTTSVDFLTETICGAVTSFSPFTVAEQPRTAQEIAFVQPPPQVQGTASVSLVATASSGLPVSFQVVSGPGTVAGNTLTLTGIGDIVVRASQAGDAQFLPAPTVDRTIHVSARRVAGSGYITPETSLYRATFSVNVIGGNPPTGTVSYTYARTRMVFVSTAITDMTVVGTQAMITGVGKVNGVAGYTFTATAQDGAPDRFGMVIRLPNGTQYYAAGVSSLAGGLVALRIQP